MKPPLYFLVLTGVILSVWVRSSHQQVIIQGIQSRNFTSLDTAFFTVQVDTSVTDDGQWFKDGTALQHQSGVMEIVKSSGYRQLAIPNVGRSDIGWYNYTIRGESTAAYLNVFDPPLRLVVALTNVTVNVGGEIMLRAMLSRSNVTGGSWTRDGSPVIQASAVILVNGQEQRLTITNAQASDSGRYVFSVGPITTSADVTVQGDPIPVNGGWSDWSQWRRLGECTATCNTAEVRTESKTRACDNPLPENGGLPCSGFANENQTIQCGPQACPINGTWSTWGNWGPVTDCSATCGINVQGSRQRFRQCDSPRPQNGGFSCPGNQTESEPGVCTSVPTSCVASIFSQGLQDITISVGQELVFTVVVSQTGLSGAWFKDGSPISNFNHIITTSFENYYYLFISSVSSADQGRYSFTVNGESTTSFVTVSGTVPVNGGWSDWSVWIRNNDCSATCGTPDFGTETRTRTCSNPAPQNGGQTCSGPANETQPVQCGPAACPVNGVWSDWGNWGAVRNCSADCGTAQGFRDRYRQCNNPSPQDGGLSCPGSAMETESAPCTSLPPCTVFESGLQDTVRNVGDDVTFTVTLTQSGLGGTWYKTGVSTPLANTGRITITQTATTHILSISNLQTSDMGEYSLTVNGETTSAFLTVIGPSPIDGVWSNWGSWGEVVNCAATCGTFVVGTKERSRQCNSPSPQNGGAECAGSATELDTDFCRSIPSSCAVAVWGQWTSFNFTACSVSCGQGFRRRTYTRTCSVPNSCTGGSATVTRFENCNDGSCPVGVWGQWTSSSFTACSVSCGVGTRQRTYTRTCSIPNTCTGGSGTITRSENCNIQSCPVGVWGQWTSSSVTACSVTCGPGSRQRTYTRTCSIPNTCTGGFGSTIRSENCNPGSCTVPFWSQWEATSVTSCSVTCGQGILERTYTRTCSVPNSCTGGSDTDIRVEPCNPRPCIVGVWGQWTSSSVTGCSVTCGPGSRQRTYTRNCSIPNSCSGGSGSTIRAENCNLGSCTVTFAQGLSNSSYTQGGQVMLQVTLSQSGLSGVWSKNGVQIFRNSKYDIVQRGTTQILYINNFQASDAGFYTFTVNGQSTSAWITAEPIGVNVGQWGMWIEEPCAVSCGSDDHIAVSRRNRTCLAADGQCNVILTQTRSSPCGRDPCPVHGGYSEWTNWSDPPCDVTCGSHRFKKIERVRVCNNPRPSNGGNTCVGPSTETNTRLCKFKECEVHGNVTAWTTWENDTCSATCGIHATRSIYRSRTCTNPLPQNGGRFCTQHLYESLTKGCGHSECEEDALDFLSKDRNGWIIAAIGAAIAVGVILIILIVACCVWHCCRSGPRKGSHTDKISACDLDVLPPNEADYVTRGKYMNQNISTTSDRIKYT